MNLFHKPTNEKRMEVTLELHQFDHRLGAPAHRSMDFLQPYPAEGLVNGQVRSLDLNLWHGVFLPLCSLSFDEPTN